VSPLYSDFFFEGGPPRNLHYDHPSNPDSYPLTLGLNSEGCPFELVDIAPIILDNGCLRVLNGEKAVKGGVNHCLPAEQILPPQNASLWGHPLPVSRNLWYHFANADADEYGTPDNCRGVSHPSFLYRNKVSEEEMNKVMNACERVLSAKGFASTKGWDECNSPVYEGKALPACVVAEDGGLTCA